MVTNLPAMRETWVQSLGEEDPPEEGMATHSPLQYSCLENSKDRGAWRANSPQGCKKSDMAERLRLSFTLVPGVGI